MKDSSPAVRGTKFRCKIHSQLPNAINSFEISNAVGAICGGNARMFCLWTDIGPGCLHYPAVFKSRGSGERYMIEDHKYLDTVVAGIVERAGL